MVCYHLCVFVFLRIYFYICLHVWNTSEKMYNKSIASLEGIGGWKTVERRILTVHSYPFKSFDFWAISMHCLFKINYFYILTASLRWNWLTVSCTYLKCIIMFWHICIPVEPSLQSEVWTYPIPLSFLGPFVILPFSLSPLNFPSHPTIKDYRLVCII